MTIPDYDRAARALETVCDRLGVRVETKHVPARTDRLESDWDHEATHWAFRLYHGTGPHSDLPCYVGFYSQGSAVAGVPSTADVVAALVRDAMAFETSPDVDDFAEDYGYEKPSDAIRAWEACRFAAEMLAQFPARQRDALVSLVGML